MGLMIEDWDWDNHLGTPVWGVLAACAVLGFDGHQLGDLAGDDGFGEETSGLDFELCWEGRFGLTAAMHVAHLVAFQPPGGGYELHSQVLC